MLVQITVKIDGGEVGTVARELSGSAADMEEALRETEQRSGRMVMERVLHQIAGQVRDASVLRPVDEKLRPPDHHGVDDVR